MTNLYYVFISILIFFSLNFIFGYFLSRKIYAIKAIMRNVDQKIDAVRGFLCFFVFIGHSVLAYNLISLENVFWPPLDKFKSINYLAVVGIDGFFFITGYLFALHLDRDITPSVFIKKRVIRLIPAFLLVTTCVVIFKICTGQNYGIFEGYFVWLAKNFKYSHEFDELIFGHYWSLRSEWQFYIVVCTLAVFKLKKPNYILSLILLTLTIFVDNTFSMIFSGVISYELLKNKKINTIFSMNVSRIIVFGIFIFYLTFGLNENYANYVRYLLRWSIMTFLGIMFFCNGRWGFFSNRVFSLAMYSGLPAYSLYLSHGFLLYICLFYGKSYYQHTPEITFFLPYFVIPIWVCFSWIIFLVSELPYHIWRLRSPR